MGWKILGIVVGLVTDIAVSLILGLLFGLVLAAYLAGQGVAAHDLAAQITALQKEPYIILAEIGLGSFGSLIGGFVTGWIARSHRVVCGAIMGFCSCLAALPFWPGEPLWSNLLGLLMTLMLATGGGWAAEAILGRTALTPPPR
jgi:hypothetical protein